MSSQTFLITGATSGIGRAAAISLAQAGHLVFAAGRRADLLTTLAADCPAGRLEPLVMDVNDPASVLAAAEQVRARTGGRGVDVIVNNAGYGQLGAVLDVDDAAVQAQFQTNVFGLLRVTRTFIHGMLDRGAGRVILISSVGGRVTFPLGGVYSATKYAVESLADAMRIELAPLGVQVSVIEPGAVRTEFGAVAVHSLADAAPAGSPWAPAYRVADAALARYEASAPGPEGVVTAITHAATSAWPRARYVAPRRYAPMLWALLRLPTWALDTLHALTFGLTRRNLRTPAPATVGGAA